MAGTEDMCSKIEYPDIYEPKPCGKSLVISDIFTRESSPELDLLFPELQNDYDYDTLGNNSNGNEDRNNGSKLYLEEDKTEKTEGSNSNSTDSQNINTMEGSNYDEIPENLDDVISKAIISFDEFNESKPYNSNETTSVLDLSPFDTPPSVSSVTDDEVTGDNGNSKNKTKSKASTDNIDNIDTTLKPNLATISIIKKSMVDTSKLISLFTTLKVTYLKLCKEFNYLLSKFNENEKVKLELINENNELKKLLMEIITERELDRKNFNHQLEQERKKRKLDT